MSSKFAALTTKLMDLPLDDLEGQWTQLLAQQGHTPVTWQALDHVLAEERAAAHQRLTALEARILVLEAVPVPLYRGTHQEGKAYPSNTLITRAGGLWISIMSTTSVPGTDPSWKL
ncbi:MAG: hypothetical protein M3545_06370, partial [Acidobacteriota bacterium]|nr:hypothetical protein [Acidobacteriota bacterium]